MSIKMKFCSVVNTSFHEVNRFHISWMWLLDLVLVGADQGEGRSENCKNKGKCPSTELIEPECVNFCVVQHNAEVGDHIQNGKT